MKTKWEAQTAEETRVQKRRARDLAAYHRKKAEGVYKRRVESRAQKTMRQMKMYVRNNNPGALVKWANTEAMLAIYENANRISRDTGVPQSVDHIVPLLNANVCGLHCEANLQILEFSLNRVKGHRNFECDNNVDIPFVGAKPAPSDLIPGLEDKAKGAFPW